MTYPHMQTIRSDIANLQFTRCDLHARSLRAQGRYGDLADFTRNCQSRHLLIPSWTGIDAYIQDHNTPDATARTALHPPNQQLQSPAGRPHHSSPSARLRAEATLWAIWRA